MPATWNDATTTWNAAAWGWDGAAVGGAVAAPSQMSVTARRSETTIIARPA